MLTPDEIKEAFGVKWRDANAVMYCKEGLLQYVPAVKKYLQRFPAPTARMHALCDLMEGFGVDSIETARGSEWADYVNLGDTYETTVIHFRNKWYVASLGEFIDRSPVRFK